MAGKYISRSIEPTLRKAAGEFPAVALTGPRQSGKTTLLKKLFGKAMRYVSLEPPDVRLSADEDPRGFIDMHPPPVIYDEIQYAPGLLPYIKEKIDEARSRPGQFILTGSQNLLLVERVTESLAGRAAMLRLLPLSLREALGEPQKPFPWESGGKKTAAALTGQMLWRGLLRGFYPELWANPKRDAGLWHSSYVQTYLERDVRALRQVGDLSQFQNFLRALAARSGGLLSLSDLARDLGVAVNTAKAWISILEATHQIIILRPYHANIGKRLVKSPKIYFTDVGTLCYLVGLKDTGHAAAGPMGGVIFETAVVMEIYKTIAGRGMEPLIYFWRTSDGVEVDVVLDTGGGLIPIEIKLSSTPHPGMASGARKFMEIFGNRPAPGYLVHAGSIHLPMSAGVAAIPFSQL